MGFWSDLADDIKMGIGAKEKDQDYIDRTAATIARNEGSAAASNYAAGQADKGFEDNYNAPADTSYKVTSGNTLGQIALDNGTTVAAIANASGIALSDVNNISVGQTLTIPGTTSGDTSNVYAGLPQSVFDEKTPTNAVTVDGNYYDQFGNPHGTKSARDNADVQYGRQESWNNPSNWIITSNERGDLDKQYIGSEPAPSGGNYTVPSFAAIDSGTSKPGSSLDVVVEGSQAYVTDKAGQKFTNVDSAVSSDAAIDRKVSSYEDPSNYRIDTNQQDDLVRIYVGDEGLPPISYDTPSWEAVDTAQESASDKDQYYDLTFVDGERKVLDSYGNAFDTPAEATSNDVKIVDRSNPENYEVVTTNVDGDVEPVAGAGTAIKVGNMITEARYTGEYGDPILTRNLVTGDNDFEAPSITEVLNATTYKDTPYSVEYDDESGLMSVFAPDGQRISSVPGTSVDDNMMRQSLTVLEAGYTPRTVEFEAQVDALMFGGEMFLDENKDGVPDMEISEEVQALSPMNFTAAADNKAAFAAASQVGEAPAPRTPGNRAGVVVEDPSGRTLGDSATDFAKGIGTGVVNTIASGAKGMGAVQKADAAATVEALVQTLTDAGDIKSKYQSVMNDLMSDENIARGLISAMDPVEYLENFEVEVEVAPGRSVTMNASMLQGRIQNEQQRIINATEQHNEAMEAAGVIVDETYWGQLADTIKEKGSDLVGKPGEADSFAYQVGNGFGSALAFIALSAPAVLAGPAAAPALAATFAATGGALVNAGSMYDEAYAFAKEQGKTDAEADAIALQGTGYATLIGTLEGIPVARALGFVPPQFGSQVAEFFTDIIAEGGQEGLNQTLNNLTAQGIWDPNRGMFDGTVDAAVMGGIVGGAISGGARMTKSMRDGLKANGYSDTEIAMIEESDGGIVTGEMSPARIEALLNRGYTIEQISGVFGNLTGTNTIYAMTDAPSLSGSGLPAINMISGSPAGIYNQTVTQSAVDLVNGPAFGDEGFTERLREVAAENSIAVGDNTFMPMQVYTELVDRVNNPDFKVINPVEMTIEGMAANSAFQDTVIKTGAGDPAIMYGNPANNMFSATAPSPDASPVYLDVKNPFTIESIGTPKGKETLTEVLGSSRADALISEFQQNGSVTLTGADVQKVAESGYDGVIDNDSGRVYVADNSSVYSVTDPETTTEETVVATKPEWKTQLDEAFYLTGSIDMDLAKQVEQEFGVSPFEINEHYQQITASDAAWEKRLLGDYLTKGYIDLDTMLKAEEDFGVSMQDLGNYAEYLDSDLSVYNDAMFADQIKEVQDLTGSQTSLQSEVTSLTNELSAVEADLVEMTKNRDLDSEAASTAIAKQEQLSGELSAKKEELAGVEKTLGETQTALEAETKTRATAEQNVTSLTSDLDSANSTITDLQSSLDAANDKVSTLNTTIEGLNTEVGTAEAATEAADKVVTKLNEDIKFKDEEITGLESDVKAAEDAVLAKQDELDTASANAETSAETIADLNSEIKALEDAKTGLDGDLSTAIGERDSLQGTLDERTKERDTLQESLTSSNTQLEAANKQLTAANTQVTDLTTQKEAFTKEVATLTTELGTANTNLTAALEASGSSAALAENLNTQLQTANSTISSMTTTLNETMADVTALEKEIASQKENQTISDADLAAAEASLEAANLEVQTLSDALTLEESAKESLQKKLTSAESDLSKLQESSSKSIESLGLEVDTANATIESLQGQLTTATNDVSTLSNQLEAAQNSQTATAEQKAALAGQLDAAQKEATSLLSDITKLEGQRDTLKADLTAAEATVGTQDTTITDLTDRLSTANTSIGTLQEQLTTATNDVSNLSSQLKAAQNSQTATAEQKAALAGQLDAAQKEATSLLSDITKLEGQRDTLKADLTAAESTIGTQETTIGNQAEAITTLTTDLSTANQDIGSLNQQLGTANESVTALEGQLEAANNSLTATQTEKDTIAANLDTARENARALTESLSARTKERDNLQVSLNDTKTTLSNTVTLANTLQTNLDASNAEINTLGNQLDMAQANVNSLKETLTDATALQELTDAEKLDLQNDLTASQNDVQSLTDQLGSRTTERNNIEKQLTETKAELTASTTLTETLQGNLTTAQENILGLESQLGDSQALQQLTEEQRAALEQTLAEEQVNAASLETQLGEVTSAFDITQTQLDFAQGATTYINTQLDQNVAEDALVADLVTRGYTADNAQALVNEVQQTRFEQSELARITDARRSAAYVPFGAGPVGGEEDEVTYPDYGPPGTGTVQPQAQAQAQQPYQPPATAYQPPPTQPVYEAPRFDPFTRDDATPIAGGPAVELDQFGQPILSFGSTGRPLGSYVTMPTSAGPFNPYEMEMPEAPAFNPQQPVVRPPFPQQPQPVINQGIGGLGRK